MIPLALLAVLIILELTFNAGRWIADAAAAARQKQRGPARNADEAPPRQHAP